MRCARVAKSLPWRQFQARESAFHARSGEVLRHCRRARGEEERHDSERDELHRALKSALETQVIACSNEWLGSAMRPTTMHAEGGAERQDSVTNGLRQIDCHLSNDVGRLGHEQEAKHKEVHQAAAMTVEAFDNKARATFEGQSSDRIAKINGLTKVIVLLVEIVVIVKQLKDEMSADLTAFKKKGLDRRTNHQDLTKAKTEEIFVLTKSTEEKETSALKLEQSAKEVSQPRPTRPPPWRDKFRACQSGAKSEEQSHNRAESMLWLVSSYLEDKAASQEGGE